MTSGWPLGGAIEGCPWRTTAYGLGVMIGTGPEKTCVIGCTGAAGPAAWSRSIIIPTQRCLLPRRPFREAKAELRYKPSRRGRNEVNPAGGAQFPLRNSKSIQARSQGRGVAGPCAANSIHVVSSVSPAKSELFRTAPGQTLAPTQP